MSLMNIFDISGSAMSAQSVRLNTTASNMANANSAARTADETYKARFPIFSAIQTRAQAAMLRGDSFSAGAFGDSAFAEEPGTGVQVLGIVESSRPLEPRYEPEHPLANDDGYVFYPDVNVVEEMTNMISSSRSFQMNVDVMNSARTMMQRVLSLGQ